MDGEEGEDRAGNFELVAAPHDEEPEQGGRGTEATVPKTGEEPGPGPRARRTSTLGKCKHLIDSVAVLAKKPYGVHSNRRRQPSIPTLSKISTFWDTLDAGEEENPAEEVTGEPAGSHTREPVSFKRSHGVRGPRHCQSTPTLSEILSRWDDPMDGVEEKLASEHTEEKPELPPKTSRRSNSIPEQGGNSTAAVQQTGLRPGPRSRRGVARVQRVARKQLTDSVDTLVRGRGGKSTSSPVAQEDDVCVLTRIKPQGDSNV